MTASRESLQSLLGSQNEVLELAVSGAALTDVLGLLIRAVQRHSGEDSRATIFMVEPDGAHLRFGVSAGMSASYTSEVDHFPIAPGSPSCGAAALTSQTVIVGDVTRDPRWAPYLDLARRYEFRAVWSVPMRTLGGRVLGTMALYYPSPREPGPGDLDAVNLMSKTGAVLIERHEEQEQRRHAEEELRQSEVRYRRLFQTAKDGILILDATSGKIIDANAFMSGLLGQELPELVGKELWEIGLFGDIAENKNAFNRLKQDGYVRYDHLPVQNPRGEMVHVEFISNTYREGDRMVAQCNVRDISARVAMEEQIKRQTEALADQSRHKDEFLAMLSHELRNPLAPIRSATHLLRLQERGSENLIQQQAREVIERQVTTLTRLVSDLMQVSRALTGRIRLNIQTVDMTQLLRHAVETAQPLIDKRGQTLTTSFGTEPVWAKVDPTRMEEVFVNLLGNAAKYTQEGGAIEMACERHSNHALVRVRDNGAGIEPALLPRIFDLFTQADRTLDRAQGGLGIGLSLAHRLVELHGGTIEARSEGPGRGSEFVVRVQLAPAPGVVPQAPPPEETVPADGLRVLVVDDNIDACLMLANLVRLRGHGVQSAHTGTDALAIAASWRPDVVLLDIGLPQVDGYEVARRLRAAPATRTVKLIAVTGYGADKDIHLGREAGFDAHLVKPADLAEIERLFAGWQRARPAQEESDAHPGR